MKYRVMVLSAVIIASSTVFAFANEHFNVDEKVNHMKSELNLTDDQVKVIKPILEDYKNTMELAEKEKRHRLESVLTGDQMKKMMDTVNDHKKMKAN